MFATEEATVYAVRRHRGTAGSYVILKGKSGTYYTHMHTSANLLTNPDTKRPFKQGDKVNAGQAFTYITGSGTQSGRLIRQKTKELGSVQAAVAYWNKNNWGGHNAPHLHFETSTAPYSGKFNPDKLFPEMSRARRKEIQEGSGSSAVKQQFMNPSATSAGLRAMRGPSTTPDAPYLSAGQKEGYNPPSGRAIGSKINYTNFTGFNDQTSAVTAYTGPQDDFLGAPTAETEAQTATRLAGTGENKSMEVAETSGGDAAYKTAKEHKADLGGNQSTGGGRTPSMRNNPETEAPSAGSSGYGAAGKCWVAITGALFFAPQMLQFLPW